MGLQSTGADADPALLADARIALREEQRREIRRTTLLGGVVAIAALPAWSVFDLLLVPEEAHSFLMARLVGLCVLAVLWVVLWRRPTGRWPVVLSLATVSTVEVTIAWMVPRVGTQLDAYLLGMSLAIYATAFLITWRWWMGAALAAITAAATAASSLTAPVGLSARQATITAFYLGTAFALALVSQIYREHQLWRQHLTQAALGRERARNGVLVDELEQISRQDPLTGLANRRAWDEALAAEDLKARRGDRAPSLLVIDVDRFKAINDLGGHTTGDAALRAIAAVLADTAEDGHFVARPGGDEFTILCPATSQADAICLAEHIHAALAADPLLDELGTTCSIGLAELDAQDSSTAALYRRADDAMYLAKRSSDATRSALPTSADPRAAARR
jgi:diguanylate cyclase (GGDEF)-like protein